MDVLKSRKRPSRQTRRKNSHHMWLTPQKISSVKELETPPCGHKSQGHHTIDHRDESTERKRWSSVKIGLRQPDQHWNCFRSCTGDGRNLVFNVQLCCFTSTVTIRTIRDREPRTATSTFTQLLSSVILVQCCFTSTVTVRLITDGEPRTASSTFTQLLSSVTSSQPERLYQGEATPGTVGGRDSSVVRAPNS